MASELKASRASEGISELTLTWIMSDWQSSRRDDSQLFIFRD